MKEPIDKRQDTPPHMYGEGQTKQGDIKSVRAEVISTADDNVNIAEPSSATHPEYPYNKVEHTLSGHLFETDDTPGAERIMEMHKSGTFYEIHPDGTKVTKIFGDDFYIVLDDHNLVVGGNLNITVQGNANFLVKGNAKTKIAGDYNLVVHGNMSTRVHGSQTNYTKGSLDVQTASSLKVRSEGNSEFYAGDTINLECYETMKLTSTRAGMEFWTYKTTPHLHYYDPDTIEKYFIGGVSYSPTGETPDYLIIDDNDPGGGLNVADSVVEPSFENMKILRSDNNDLGDVISTSTTFPKDRSNHS